MGPESIPEPEQKILGEDESLLESGTELSEKDRNEFSELIRKIMQNKWAKALLKEIINPLDEESLSSLLRKEIKNKIKN